MGSSCLFWTDIWNDRLHSTQFPELFSFAKDRHISVQKFLSAGKCLNSFIFLSLLKPMTRLAFLLEGTHLLQGKDVWSHNWGSNVLASNKLICIWWAPDRCLWHTLGRGTPIVSPNEKFQELLKRKNMVLENYNCVLCHLDTEEFLLHLFLHCPFARSCWKFWV